VKKKIVTFTQMTDSSDYNILCYRAKIFFNDFVKTGCALHLHLPHSTTATTTTTAKDVLGTKMK